ncbi:MAG TPA: type II secretion system protein [Candidatus Paceibacterota bacterium]|nr:type II secretion system protein [Candidatus Paceibacterota bacterium]
MRKNKSGFTLIELLIVIAVIGLLAAVVVASLNTAKNKSADSAVKEAMHSIRNQADLYYLAQTPNTYGANVTACTTASVFTDSIVTSARAQILTQAAAGATMNCATSTDGLKWALSVSALKQAGTSWCIDSSAFFGASKTAQTSGANQGTCQ